MTKEEILTKAIKKAIAGGWNNEEMYSFDTRVGEGLFNPGIGEYGGHEDVSVLIYNHDFAKALWNAPKMLEMDFTQPSFETRDGRSEWQYHLQNMVIAHDPIKYLGDNI